MVNKLWRPKGKVWFRHNDDSTLGKESPIEIQEKQEQADRNISNKFNPDNRYKRIQRKILKEVFE